ncbi:MAG TPA: hypothetical protein PKH02_02060 [Bacteroidales bacterium]|nr:hypothetical protein [Bacteroidales bacterium]HPT11903.1 hypothetical protein [Bacteroidales bacterium]
MKSVKFLPKMILLAIVPIAFNACNKNETDLTYDISGNWKVSAFVNYETSEVITKTEDNTWIESNNGDITVSFMKNSFTGGIIYGVSVTNTFTGDFSIGQRGTIKISNILQTMVGEPEWGRLFDSIDEAETFEVKNGQLVIYYNKGRNAITFDRMTD